MPVFPDYAPVKPTNPIDKVKETMNQIKLVNAKTKFLLDKKKRDIAETQSLNDFKNRMIIHDLIQSIVYQKVCKSQIFYFCDATFKNE